MQNGAEPNEKGNPIAKQEANLGKSAARRKARVRNITVLISAAIALFASAYIGYEQFLPPTSLQEETDYYEVPPEPIEITSALPSLLPIVPVLEKEPVLVSQLPDINQALVSQPSRIPGWLTSSVKQQVQPSPKRSLEIAIEDHNDDSLVVRDRVVVIPKTLMITTNPQAAKIDAASQVAKNPVQARSTLQSKHYTIQVLASRTRERIMRFVDGCKINANAKIRLAKRDGLEWYVLTVGEFDQMQQAKAALNKLPGEFAQFNPWIRPISQLKSIS